MISHHNFLHRIHIRGCLPWAAPPPRSLIKPAYPSSRSLDKVPHSVSFYFFYICNDIGITCVIKIFGWPQRRSLKNHKAETLSTFLIVTYKSRPQSRTEIILVKNPECEFLPIICVSSALEFCLNLLSIGCFDDPLKCHWELHEKDPEDNLFNNGIW